MGTNSESATSRIQPANHSALRDEIRAVGFDGEVRSRTHTTVSPSTPPSSPGKPLFFLSFFFVLDVFLSFFVLSLFVFHSSFHSLFLSTCFCSFLHFVSFSGCQYSSFVHGCCFFFCFSCLFCISMCLFISLFRFIFLFILMFCCYVHVFSFFHVFFF